LQRRVGDLLTRERLAASGAVSSVDTPRRLAVLAPGIPAAQPDVTEQINGPAVSVAFKDGSLRRPRTRLQKGWSRGCEIGTGDYPKVNISRRRSPSADAPRRKFCRIASQRIASIYWPKNMYCASRARGCASGAVAGGDAGRSGGTAGVWRCAGWNQSRGHRILSDGSVVIPRAGEAYVESLRGAKSGRAEREHQIRKLGRCDPHCSWCALARDKSLLDTVVNLTEGRRRFWAASIGIS